MNIPLLISDELKIKIDQVNAVIDLFNDDATIPFIARYRKEKTGGVDEEVLRDIEERRNYLTLLESRKETILKSIEEQGKLTEELKSKINSSLLLREIEDLYLPYKPKRKTRGMIAKAKGLEPLANFILNNPNFQGSLEEKGEEYLNEEKGVTDVSDALSGAKDIIAEMISDDADVRNVVRTELWNDGFIGTKKAGKEEVQNKNKKDVYEIYHDFKIELDRIKPYQVLAINRGEREKFIKLNFNFDQPEILNGIYSEYFGKTESNFREFLEDSVEDSFGRLVFPSIERELRKHLTEIADDHAVEIFASNLRQLLLQPPISNQTIMGIDPGFVSGSKVAVIDTTGKYIEGVTIYPHPPQNRIGAAKRIILEYIKNHNVGLIAIGNGTASRETELMVADLIADNGLDTKYLIVNEAGASVYSASPVAKQEFPDLDASMRGNISIARRVLDPLAELVKIEPKSIGVGLYQHDVDQKLLGKELDEVVMSCVNYVGVDLNTASASLLTYVSGLNKRIANNIVSYRESNGRFTTRKELMKVTGIGAKAFEQSAGFLKIPSGKNPLDNTFIHPESYKATSNLLELSKIDTSEIKTKGALLKLFVNQKGKLKTAEELGIGEPTLDDILENLSRPGRDPREEMPKPMLRSDVLKMDDLEEGMKLKGTVRNVVDFGAFVDIGIKDDGLIHISKIAKKFIKHPIEILSVGDIIEITIIGIDKKKGRISLSMVED